MNYSEMDNKGKNKEQIDKVMINKDMYNQELNIEEDNSHENNNGVNKNQDNDFEDFGVDDILDIYIPESSDNIESPDKNIDNEYDKENKESKLNNVVFYKQDSDEVIIIRNDTKNKWNNKNSLPF